MTTPPGYTVPTTQPMTTFIGGDTPPPDELCDGTSTIHVDPNGDCSQYQSSIQKVHRKYGTIDMWFL